MLHKTHLFGVDVLRLMAAVMVVFNHLAFWGFAGGNKFLLPLLGKNFGESTAPLGFFGWVGVEIFFVISGFVIYYSADSATAFVFFRSRFLRLWPCVWIAATLALPLAYVVNKHDLAHVAKLYVRSMAIYPHHPYVIEAMWTLPVEISFYAVVLFLIGVNRISLLGIVSCIVGLYSSAFWLVYGYGLLDNNAIVAKFNLLTWSFLTHISLLHHGCFFALGVSLCRVFMRDDFGRHVLLVPVYLVACVLEIISMNASKVIETGVLQPAAVPSAIWLFSVGFLTLAVKHNAYLHDKFGKRAKAIRFGGLLTYPLYLVHEPVAYFLIYALTLAHVPPSVAWLISLIMAFYVAYLVTQHYEPWLKQRTRVIVDRIYMRVSR